MQLGGYARVSARMCLVLARTHVRTRPGAFPYLPGYIFVPARLHLCIRPATRMHLRGYRNVPARM